MSAFKDIVEGKPGRYSEAFTNGSLSALPHARLVIVTCMDTRIDPLAIFGLDIGEAHVLRNAVPVTPDVIRSLIKSINQLEVERVVVMHHTYCGAAKIKIDSLRTAVVSATGNDPADVNFHLIGDPAEALAADVEAVRSGPYFPVGTAVAGMLYAREQRHRDQAPRNLRRLSDRLGRAGPARTQTSRKRETAIPAPMAPMRMPTTPSVPEDEEHLATTGSPGNRRPAERPWSSGATSGRRV